MIKCIPRGEQAQLHLTTESHILIANPLSRYVEMLEQQQAWLVHGLQELYRRTTEGEGWPGDRLKPEPNGHPLTHDLLTRLGALDHSKGDHFEENPETMQQELWRNDMQRQESSDGSSESAQSPVARSRFSSDAFSHSQTMPPTPPTSYSPSSQAPIKSEMTSSSSNPPFGMSMPGVVNPLALQGGQQWNNNGFSPFDEMDLMSTADYTNLSFDESNSLPMFSRQVPMNCISNDYEDFNQFLNPSAAEIISI